MAIVLPLHFVISLLLLGFGYGIYIKRNYKLINSYKDAKKRFRDFKGYARTLGAIEFYGGLINLLLAVVSYFYRSLSLYLLIFGSLGVLFILIYHDARSFQQEKELRKKGKKRR